jgi:tetratricopeptide (TPR) repeat protein
LILCKTTEQSKSWQEHGVALDRLAEALVHSKSRVEACLRAARTWSENVGDDARALASLAIALADDPGQPEAFSWTESLLTGRRDFDELSRLYQRRINTCKEPQLLVDLLWRHALLLRDQLGQPERAVGQLNALLKLSPNDISALTALARLREARNHWADAAATLRLIIERSDDSAVRDDARLRLASALIEHLNEPQQAKEVLEQARGGEAFAEVLRLRARLAIRTGAWQEARDVLEELQEQKKDKLWALLQLIDVAQLGLHDATQAAELARQAVEHATTSPSAMEGLRGHDGAAKNFRRLVSAAEKSLQQAPPAQAAPIRSMIVQVSINDLDDPKAALPHAEALAKLDPESVAAGLLYAQTLKQAHSPAASAEYQRLLTLDVTCVAAYEGLAQTAPSRIDSSAAALLALLSPERLGSESREKLESFNATTVRGAFARSFTEVEGPLREVETMWSELQPLLAPLVPPVQGQRLGSDHPASQVAAGLAHALRLAPAHLVVQPSERAAALATSFLGDPVGVSVSPQLVEQGDSERLRFWVGRALAMGWTESIWLTYTQDEIGDLFATLCGQKPRTTPGQQLKKESSRLARKDRKRLEQLTAPSIEQLMAYRDARNLIADRVALVLGRNPGAGLAAIAQAQRVDARELLAKPRYAELARFAVSKRFWEAFESVW